MPLYEYKCSRCGEVFEAMQKFSDPPLRVHEKCGGTVDRLLSAPALQFKGSGWYVTDYGKGNGSAAGSRAGKNGKESKSTAPKTESKPSASETKSSS